jgi:acyl carrier protein
VVVEAECRFDIQFQPAEIEQLTTVRDLVRLIQAKRAQAKRALIHA